MNVVQLREIFDWLAPTSICELELHTAQSHLRLRREPNAADNTVIVSPGPAANTASSAPTAESSTPPLVAKAPCVGTFLHRHPLRDEDLAPTGSTVKAGQVIGLLQVGALLMPLEAPADGIVIEHLVKHGSIAGYGNALIALEAR
jgi:acetyl-CoA carboxylase biotin carboxyl carrier protein